MRKIILSLLILVGLLTISPLVSAQGMMGQFRDGWANSDASDTAKDEAEGKAVWEKLQSKQTDCKNLSDDDYDVLGDYFMGLMMGNGHSSMNLRMAQMMGEEGEKQMHIVMGKRLSGCDTNASISQQYETFLPWANMMGRFNNGFSGIHFVAWISLILFWTILVLVIISLIRYIRTPSSK